MPYNSVKDLPPSVKKVLPVSGQKLFLQVFNKEFAKTKGDETMSFRVAWGVVKKQFKKKGTKWVANSSDFVNPEFFEFELIPSGTEIVINDEDGELVMDAVLADTSKNKQGLHFGLEELKDIADQINMNGSTLPDISHMTWGEINKDYLQQFLSDEELVNLMKKRKGVFKDIKALVKEGKLWIRAKLDKRYKNHVDKFKGVSIETVAKRNGDKLINPLYMGFTFTDNPALKEALIVK